MKNGVHWTPKCRIVSIGIVLINLAYSFDWTLEICLNLSAIIKEEKG